MYQRGWDQFIPFAITIAAIVFTDLLIGVLIGLAVSVFFILRSNFKKPFTLEKQKLHVDETIRLELSNEVSFFSKANIKETLWNIPEGSKVIIDASGSDYVDQDVLEVISDFKNVAAPQRKVELNVIGLKEKYQLNDHVQFVNVLDREKQQKLKPQEIITLLKDGNERFVNGKWSHKYFEHQINATSFGQTKDWENISREWIRLSFYKFTIKLVINII